MGKDLSEKSATRIVALTMRINRATSLEEIRLAADIIRREARDWYRRDRGKQRTRRCRERKRQNDRTGSR